ncbi:hypothetical protein AK812_SmicGene26285 [Symbiodinium microadriaticum]|uniref:Uncharacterized protein n=1 Tax=Symbiodinium microadriaticum TaxID=2951 RepID=A0A1Q9D9X0_SYMMI|nr:hypothetical protein AK812_SmicGene26285 [Symbiodinium microadriaticum]
MSAAAVAVVVLRNQGRLSDRPRRQNSREASYRQSPSTSDFLQQAAQKAPVVVVRIEVQSTSLATALQTKDLEVRLKSKGQVLATLKARKPGPPLMSRLFGCFASSSPASSSEDTRAPPAEPSEPPPMTPEVEDKSTCPDKPGLGDDPEDTETMDTEMPQIEPDAADSFRKEFRPTEFIFTGQFEVVVELVQPQWPLRGKVGPWSSGVLYWGIL